jgi:hypothetical protein
VVEYGATVTADVQQEEERRARVREARAEARGRAESAAQRQRAAPHRTPHAAHPSRGHDACEP